MESNLIGRNSLYLEDIHVVFQLLQLLHPLLDDILDFRLSDHQDFLPRQHRQHKELNDNELMTRLACSQIYHRTLFPAKEKPSWKVCLKI